MGAARALASHRAGTRAPKRAAAVNAIITTCLAAGRVPVPMSTAVSALRQIQAGGVPLFTTYAMCTDTIHRAVHAGVLRRIQPGGGTAAPHRWALLWPVALGSPARVPWTASSQPVIEPLRRLLDLLATEPAVEWLTAHTLAASFGWDDAGAVARVQQHLIKALRGGAPGLLRRRAADRLTWCWSVPVGLCAPRPHGVATRGFGRAPIADAMARARYAYRCVAIEWRMLITPGSDRGDVLALRQQLAVACAPPRAVAGRTPPRVVRLDGPCGRVWYATPDAYSAADAELTLRGVSAAVTTLTRRRAQHPTRKRGALPAWIVSFLWRIASGAARCLRQYAGSPTSWPQVDTTRHALLTGCGLDVTGSSSARPPHTRWVSWNAGDMLVWMDATQCRLRLRDVRDAAQSHGVWSWDSRIVRALPNAIVSDSAAHHGDALVEVTDLLLWLTSLHASPAVAVAARAARQGLDLRRGPAAHQWCAAQWAAPEPWARVSRVAGAALCGRVPDATTLLPPPVPAS